MALHSEKTKDGQTIIIEQKRGRCIIKSYVDAETLNIVGEYTNMDLLKKDIRESIYHKD